MSIPFGCLDLAGLDNLGAQPRYHWSRAPMLRLQLDTLTGELEYSFSWGDDSYAHNGDLRMDANDMTYALPHLLDTMLPQELTMPC